jgi:hypothetical protein
MADEDAITKKRAQREASQYPLQRRADPWCFSSVFAIGVFRRPSLCAPSSFVD